MLANKPGIAASDEEIAAHKAAVKRAQAAYDAELKKIEDDRKELKMRKTRILDQLDGVPATSAEAKKPAAEKPAPAGKPVLKFDKDGNRVTN